MVFGAGGGTNSYQEIEETDVIFLWGSNARETHPIFFHHLLKGVRNGARLYGIDPQAVEDAWVAQYTRTVGVVNLNDVQFDADCLRLINRRQAWQVHLLPAYREGDQLHIATDAENLVRAVNFSSRRIDEAVYFLVAERQQLRDFLMKHYPVPEHIAQFAEKM